MRSSDVRRQNSPLWLGLFLLALLALAATVGFWFPSETPYRLEDAFCRAGKTHWLGCDAFGVDLGVRVLIGARQTLLIALLVTAISMALGLLVGTASGLAQSGLRIFLDRVIDCFLAFPGLLLSILIASVLPPSQTSLILALSLTGWAARARFCRALVLKIRGEPFVEAAHATGASTPRIVYRHLWPSLFGQLLVQCAIAMTQVILAEASLSFLGFGGGVDNPSWGKLIAEGREYLVEAPHLSLVPGLAFVLTVLGFQLLAEGLRKKLDPSQNLGLY